MPKFLDPRQAFAAMEGLQNGTLQLPSEIKELREQIKSETRVAEVRASVTGEIDREMVAKIVSMKLDLDRLYGEWIQSQSSVIT